MSKDLKNIIFWILSKDPKGITGLKLQCLLFYIHSLFYAYFDKKLFSQTFEAQEEGPFVKDVYLNFKYYGSEPIQKFEEYSLEEFSQDEISFLDEAYQLFGAYEDWSLLEMVYREKPWITAFNKGSGTIIEDSAVNEWFKAKYIK